MHKLRMKLAEMLVGKSFFIANADLTDVQSKRAVIRPQV